ncbi:hypothetical protein R2601_04203 [Salipiger bermudensis HTCC2601]|uniref:Uncharacterized protein n=1 Tax=Salipiger bermudensis (strain DSM 26914 / JCM 13377 / KCTC 12554 / HTCC2601) TaxID=314265 RepID=Q0FW05_SALBH|nr:hypothetical protein R2601_04203 [Salipiger bermudensis HTCC2601]
MVDGVTVCLAAEQLREEVADHGAAVGLGFGDDFGVL